MHPRSYPRPLHYTISRPPIASTIKQSGRVFETRPGRQEIEKSPKSLYTQTVADFHYIKRLNFGRIEQIRPNLLDSAD